MICSIVVVGTSLGGLEALKVLLGGLPRDFPAPVAVVQHRAPADDDALAPLLQEGCALPVAEALDKEPIVSGRVYLAPADYHLLVDAGSLALSTEAPVCHSRPSIDVLFESAADAYGNGVVAVVLTGASEDGARGVARVKERGGLVVVEEPAGASSPVMPAAAAPFGDMVLPLRDIAVGLVRLCGRRQGGSSD